MDQTVTLPLWLFVVIVLFAAVTALSHFLLPSVRWFFRRRFERAVARLNKRLKRPIQPFKLARRYDMIQRLIYDPEVSREIALYAEKNDVPENVAFQKAQEYAREIVPSFSAFAYFSFETSTLSYAVGEWARVWPLSALIRLWGAYFIRRRSRGALYRKVLSRYVQMATNGGDTQAFYPEGGLSLTGRLQPPKVGLLSYLVDGFDPDGGRDIVFVPVAINYDRVLEDRVLMAAHARGDRRFGARVSVVVAFILRKFWQRLRGHDTRFGTAAVAFGTPLSLREFGKVENVDGLSEKLMARIEAVMPVLGVPLVASSLLRFGDQSPADLYLSVGQLIAQMPEGSVELDLDDLTSEVQRACTHMEQHGLITRQGDVWQISADQHTAVAFYANSIAHYLPEPHNPSNAAPAK